MDAFVDRYAEAWPTRRVDFDRAAFDGARVWADPEALRRMLLNVVDNAAKYSSAPRPIAVTAEAGPESVVIQVTDEGPGLSAGDRERVFDRFYRGSESRSRRTGGSGLGLSIVRALAERSAGSVSLESEPGRGTTVTITLPAAKSAPR
jgi:signal transduction histidine kinase